MKIDFYFILKALFVLKLFWFFPDFFVHVVSVSKNTPQFAHCELRQAPDSVINIFPKWYKRTLVVIINDYKTVRRNLDYHFLSWVIFNNVFSYEKDGEQFCYKIYQKRSINRRKYRMIFSRPLLFELQQFFKIQ